MNNTVTKLPLITLRGMTILPHMVIHFDVSRKKSIKATDFAMKNGQLLFVVSQKEADILEPEITDLYEYGTVVEIKQIVKSSGHYRVLVKGLYRAKMLSFMLDNNMFVSDIEATCDKCDDELYEKASIAMLCDAIEEYYAVAEKEMTGDGKRRLKAIKCLDELIYKCVADCADDFSLKQEILSCVDIKEQFRLTYEMLKEMIEIYAIKKELSFELKERIDKNQKDYILNEQLKLIKEELDEDDASEEEEFKERLAKLSAPEYVKKRLEKEIRMYSKISSHSSELHVERNYIETLLNMPWQVSTDENLDINNAEKILNDDHYGLTKVKERILEFIAVRAINTESDAPIICLVGPPGTGKTSIAKSVADALNRKYVRVCLGGVRDEAEIRGHRKTYVGAMPGRIVEGLLQAKTNNPLMLLDEIDKVGTDSRGDTASALLEILDSAQNNAFRDHYVEIPVDLSKCFFIATANDTSTIPKPLLDRMEVVELNSYTDVEKMHIATDYLVKKQLKKNGLTTKQLSVSKDAIKKMIECYTKESGVRELERTIASLCRKVAKKIALGENEQHKIKASNLSDYLGVVKYNKESKATKAEVGTVKGLAWTAVGGTTLDVEACLMPGKGEIILTGQMGDVMKESARVSLSYIRSQASIYDIDKKLFEENDIHIHLPEGAVKKDGPSAGITMTLAMFSAYTKRKVRNDIAMTGEMTLHGNVLPIGGLKEKLLAAKNIGINTVLVPVKNKKDVLDIEAEITDGMSIIYVSKMDDVIKEAFC